MNKKRMVTMFVLVGACAGLSACATTGEVEALKSRVDALESMFLQRNQMQLLPEQPPMMRSISLIRQWIRPMRPMHARLIPKPKLIACSNVQCTNKPVVS